MRVPRPLPVSLLLVLAGCAGQPAAPGIEVPATTTASLARTQVPMRGSYEGTGVFTAPPPSCAGLYSVFTGVGQESHTGRYTLDHTTCTVPLDATHSSFTGQFTKTTASGDLIYGTFEGASRLTQVPAPESPIGVFAIAGTITFAGGTGRFDGATGSQRMTGTQWTDFSSAGFPSRSALEFDGTISTVGSLR